MSARYEAMNLGSKDGFVLAATLGVPSLFSVLVISPDILDTRINATLAKTPSDIRVAGGELYRLDLGCKLLPRSLMYHRNR